MLYLVEIRKQTRGFISGWKTELRLLVRQNNDQTWSNIANEDILITDALDRFDGNVLLLVNLNNNRQIQGSAELASKGIVQQLQKLSRLLEKSRQQQEEIDRWKSSLEIQSQELSEREIALDSQYEQLEHLAEKYQTIVDERNEIERQWEQLRQLREDIEKHQRHEVSPYEDKIRKLVESSINRDNTDGNDPWSTAPEMLAVLERSQVILNGQLYELNQKKQELHEFSARIAQQEELIHQERQNLYSIEKTIEELKINIGEQKVLLMSKQQSFGRIHIQVQTLTKAQFSIKYILANIGYPLAEISEPNIDPTIVESKNPEQLEKIVKDLEIELKSLELFVKDKEDELLSKSESLEELYLRFVNSIGSEKDLIEQEILDREDSKKMLQETLLGQQDLVRAKYYSLIQYLHNIRQPEGSKYQEKISLASVLSQLTDRQKSLRQYWSKIEQDIANLVQSIGFFHAKYQAEIEKRADKQKEIEEQELNLERLKIELNVIRTKISIGEEVLEPLQDSINIMRKNLHSFNQWLGNN